MSKNIKFPPSQYGTTFEGVRSRKWKALHREKFVVDIGVHIKVGNHGYCFFHFEKVVNISGINFIARASKIDKIKKIPWHRVPPWERINTFPYIQKEKNMRVYAVFDSKNDYAEWKLKNV